MDDRDFAYRERGAKLPDRMPVLRERLEGGRVATMMAADGFPCDALLLLAYPLHPANKPEKLRDAICRASGCRCSASTPWSGSKAPTIRSAAAATSRGSAMRRAAGSG